MHITEIFKSRRTSDDSYYNRKMPLAVILALLGFSSLILCTPAGAAYLETWLKEILPFGAKVSSWIIAIGFDLTFAYILSHLFGDIFSGMNGRSNYFDVPTIILATLFGGVTLLWSVWGSDIRVAAVQEEMAIARKAEVDKGIEKIGEIIDKQEDQLALKNSGDRNTRKNNEAIAEKAKEDTKQSEKLTGLITTSTEITGKIEESKIKMVENGKVIIVAAYLFLFVMIGCVEYIKSHREGRKEEVVADTHSPSEDQKKKFLAWRAQELRAELNEDGTHKHSLRYIGTELGISHTQVRRLLETA